MEFDRILNPALSIPYIPDIGQIDTSLGDAIGIAVITHIDFHEIVFSLLIPNKFNTE